MMAGITRILVAIGERPAPVLARAAALARLHGARLILAAAVYEADAAGERFGDAADLNEARAAVVESCRVALQDLATPLAAEGLDVSVSARWALPPFEGLVAEARESGADLLVTGPARPQRPGLTNSDWQLIRHSPCGVLLIRGSGGSTYRNILVAVDPMHAHDKPGALDDALITAGLALGGPTSPRLRLLHCYLPAEYVPFRAPGAARSSVFHRRENSLAAHQSALQQLARRHGIPEPAAQLEAGDAREAIPEVARATGADLVVMGVVARSRLKRLLVGSTAESVLERLPCDVLTLKPVAATAGRLAAAGG